MYFIALEIILIADFVIFPIQFASFSASNFAFFAYFGCYILSFPFAVSSKFQ